VSGDVWGTSASVPAALNPNLDPQLGNISRVADGGLNPIPMAGGNAYTFAKKAPTSSVIQATSYLGAFGAENWAQDWSALGSEGFLAVTPIAVVGPQPTVIPGSNLKAVLSGTRVQLSWDGTATLEAASSIGGTYEAVGSTSPVELDADAAQRFFRIR
jgi:hypothetical protein